MRLVTKLDDLNDFYARAIDLAVGDDDDRRVADLVRQHDVEATRLVAEHEGRTDQLPLRLQGAPTRPARGLGRLLGVARAA